MRNATIWLLAVVALLVARSATADDFGHDTVFGSEQNGVQNKQIATQVTLAEAGDLEGITAYVKGSASKKLRFAIYTDSGGEPDALVVETASEAIGSNQYHWHTISTPATALPAGTYWLTLSFEHSIMSYVYDAVGGLTRHNDNDGEGSGYAASWGASTAASTRRISIYGTLAAAGGGTSVFGYDTIGGSETGNGQSDKQVATIYTLVEDATVLSITAYVGSKADKGVRYALYADAGGEPGALIAETASASGSASMEWLEIDLPDTWIPAGDYWLALSLDHTHQHYGYEPTGGQTRERDHNAEYLGFIDPWGVCDASSSRRVSIYATYTPGGAPPALFTDVSASTGFDVQTASGPSAGSGLHWADLDDDGDLDAIITGTTPRLMTSVNEGVSFTATAFGGGALGGQGALLDHDNDGDLDFWHHGLGLFENDGLASFTPSGSLGFDDPLVTESVAAGDVNGDGWCDLLVPAGNGNWIGHHQRSAPASFDGTADVTYGMNDPGDSGDGEYVSSGDVDGDGDIDLFYHLGGGRLFLSDGDGTFTESASGISIVTGAGDKAGSAWADFDDDGDLDLFAPRFDVGFPGSLWRNDGGVFTDVAAAAGLADASGQRSCCWGDYDNDGDLDLYIVTHSGADNLLYRNEGDGTFTAIVLGAEAGGDGHDAVFVDFDNDGDLDLAVTQQGAGNVLLRNDTDDTAYLKVRLVGWGALGTDVACIGVEVELYEADGTTFLAERHVGTARGFGGTDPLWVHFGGLDPTATYVVKAHFRSGLQTTSVVPSLTTTTIGATTIPQMLTMIEPQPALRVISWQEVAPD